MIARNFLALGLGEAVSRLLAFAATVYLARVLGASLYGVLGVSAAVILYLVPLADGGLDVGTGVRAVAKDPIALSRVVPAILTVRLVRALVLTLVVGTVALFVVPVPDGPILALYALTLIAAGSSSRWLHLAFDRAGTVAVVRSIGQLVTVALIFILVRGPSDVTRAPLAQFAGEIAASIVLLILLRRYGIRPTFVYDRAAAAPLLRQARPLVLGTLLGLTIFNSDLIFVRLFRDAEAAGFYAAAYLVVSFSVNLGLAYSMALMPSLARAATDRPAQRALYQHGLLHMVAGGLPIAVGGWVLALPLVVTVFGTAYSPAAPAFAILVWSIPLSLVRDIPIVAMITHGQERTVLRVTGMAVVLNIALNVALIPRFGMVGAAVATVVTEGVRMVLAFIAAQRYRLGFPSWRLVWRPFAAAAAMLVVLSWGAAMPVWGVVLLGAVTYGLVLMLIGGAPFRVVR